MDFTAIVAAGAILVLVAASAAFFVLGRKAGIRGEQGRQAAAGASAEQTALRIVSEAERESESLRKGAILAGKEELIGLREDWEGEARRRREDLEHDERRVQERTGVVERKMDWWNSARKRCNGWNPISRPASPSWLNGRVSWTVDLRRATQARDAGWDVGRRRQGRANQATRRRGTGRRC